MDEYNEDDKCLTGSVRDRTDDVISNDGSSSDTASDRPPSAAGCLGDPPTCHRTPLTARLGDTSSTNDSSATAAT